MVSADCKAKKSLGVVSPKFDCRELNPGHGAIGRMERPDEHVVYVHLVNAEARMEAVHIVCMPHGLVRSRE